MFLRTKEPRDYYVEQVRSQRSTVHMLFSDVLRAQTDSLADVALCVAAGMTDAKAAAVREIKAVAPSELAAFFVFNPNLGDEDTEGDKILYFYPPSVPIDIQKDYVGLTEGLINFTREWGKPAEAVHCEKHRHAFFEAEKDYWICLVAKNPSLTYAKVKDPNAPAPAPQKEITGNGPLAQRMRKAMMEKKAKEESGETEYLEDELEDAVLQAIIRRGYALYKLCNDRFSATAGVDPHAMVDGITLLRAKLSAFMSYYLPTIRFKQLPFFTDIHGFQFLPVDKATFLTIQYLVNLVTATYPGVVRASALMYNSKLIWSGLNQEDMFLLYSLEQDAMRPFFHYLSYKDRVAPKKKHQSKGNTRKAAQEAAEAAAAAGGTADGSGSGDTTPPPRVSSPTPMVPDGSSAMSNAKPTANIPFAPTSTGFLTGPLRIFPSLPVAAAAASSSAAAATSAAAPSAGGAAGSSSSSSAVGFKPTRSAPLLYLSEYPNANTATTAFGAGAGAGAGAAPGAIGSGGAISAAMANGDPFALLSGAPPPASSSSSSGPTASASASAPVALASGSYAARLVVYQQEKITLFFVIADDQPQLTAAAAAVGAPKPPAAAAAAAAAPVPSASLAPAANDMKTVPLGPTAGAELAAAVSAAAATATAAAAAASSAAAAAEGADPPPKPKKPKITTAMLTLIDDAAFENAGLFPDDDSDVWLAPEPAAVAAAPVSVSGSGSDAKGAPAAASTASGSTGGSGGSAGAGGAAAARSAAAPSTLPEFYASLEQHMSGNLKKLAAMLGEQATRSHASDDAFRFLYFNHMNLALKTSLNAKQSPLTMESIKLIRNIHADFKAAATTADPSLRAAVQAYTTAASSSAAAATNKRGVLISRSTPEVSEVCVKTAANGWVVGRRATQTHREFFVLIDEKVGTLADVQGKTALHDRACFLPLN